MGHPNLTPKQEAFCRYYVLESLTQRQAYIKAYGRGKQSDKVLDIKACNLVKTDKVWVRIKELQETLAKKALWSKEEMINDLRDIAVECKGTLGMLAELDGENVRLVDTKARAVAINAIKTAGEFLGYKAADKIEASGAIEIIIQGGDDRYGK